MNRRLFVGFSAMSSQLSGNMGILLPRAERSASVSIKGPAVQAFAGTNVHSQCAGRVYG
jgi:hypothetical protein